MYCSTTAFIFAQEKFRRNFSARFDPNRPKFPPNLIRTGENPQKFYPTFHFRCLQSLTQIFILPQCYGIFKREKSFKFMGLSSSNSTKNCYPRFGGTALVLQFHVCWPKFFNFGPANPFFSICYSLSFHKSFQFKHLPFNHLIISLNYNQPKSIFPNFKLCFTHLPMQISAAQHSHANAKIILTTNLLYLMLTFNNSINNSIYPTHPLHFPNDFQLFHRSTLQRSTYFYFPYSQLKGCYLISVPPLTQHP